LRPSHVRLVICYNFSILLTELYLTLLMNAKFLFIVLILFLPATLISAQESKQSADIEGHEHHQNEIGASFEPVYFIKEKSAYFGLHIHYVYNIPETKFGLGLGYERVFDPNRHKTIGIECCYRPISPLTFSLSPGVKFEGSGMSDTKFALHFETAYEFELADSFHLGPAFEIATDIEDYHISAGLHFGYEF
jgi:hypothetical protein